MDDLVEIQLQYDYYCKSRITPIFMSKEDLLRLTYDNFLSRVLAEIPHIAKTNAAASFRLSIVEPDRPDIDISVKYFNSQITRLLNNGMRTINIRVTGTESPPVISLEKYRRFENSPKSKRRLLVENTQNSNDSGNSTVSSVQVHVTTTGNHNNNTIKTSKEEHIVLPLERHARRYEQIVESVAQQLSSKNKELEELDNKLSNASSQNAGHLSVCGNCHLKTGHTRKACQFSPCRSAFSCGILAKHNDQKSLRASISKDVTSLQSQLRKAETDLNCAKTAMEKAKNSSSKRIEDILLAQKPDRYTTTCGRKNWLILNKDVAVLQSKLRGTLPTRTNIMNLLKTVVNEQESNSTCPTSTKTLKGTDHRVSSQKSALEEEYGIRFPVKRARVNNESSKRVVLAGQEKDDFQMALRLQQEEIDSDASEDVYTDGAETERVEELEQFEANAAAALLYLQSRK